MPPSRFAQIDRKLSERRILTLDIERTPGRFRARWRGLDVEGDFWDLKDGKRHIGRYIYPDEVTAWPATICAAWRAYGQRSYGFSSVWGGTDLTADLAARLDWAEIIVGHNIDQFDLKKINAQLLLAGLNPPSSYKTVDTLKILRSRFGLESNTLNSACERLGIQSKVDRYDPAVAKAAVAGDVAAQRRIERYNKGDIAATEALYDRLRFTGWIYNHPVVSPTAGDELRCPACGSADLKPLPTDYAAQVLTYAAYRCNNCQTPVATRHHKGRIGRTKGVK